MRFVLIFLIVIGVTVAVGAGILMKSNPSLLSSLLPNQNAESLEQAKVLGVNDDTVKKAQGIYGNVVAPAFRSIAGLLGQSVQQVASSSASPSGVIDVHKAMESAKAQAASIPEQVFDRARYEYCKQVVIEYEKKE